MIAFEHLNMFFLLALPFLVRALLPSVKGTSGKALKIPFLKDLKIIQESYFKKISINRHVLSKNFSGIFLVWCFLTLAMAKPVFVSKPVPTQNKGRDILLVTDISTSMLENDFHYNGRPLTRLEAVRAVISDFTKKRLTDRLGLILFGTRAYLQVPLTFDKKALLDVLSTMKAGMAGQSTSIGDAVGLAVKTLSSDRHKVQNRAVILLTDGENNDGNISIAKALKLAKDENIKIYTIGIGSERFDLASAFFGAPVSDLDEKSLKELAFETKGQYFKATSLSDLVAIYNKIDSLETKETDSGYIYPKKELYAYPLGAAFILLLCMLLFKLFQTKRSES